MTLARCVRPLALGLLCVATACGNDAAALGDENLGTDGPAPNASSGAGDEGGQTAPGAGTDAVGDETSADDSGDGGDTGDETGGPAAEPESCAAMDCGDGTCDVIEGVATCSCADGEVLVGMSCIPCVPTDGNTEIAIEAVTIDARVEVHGDPAPALGSEDGILSLRDLGSGDEVVLGNSHDAMLSATVVPGTYDVVWSRESGGSIVPHNSAGVIGRVRVGAGQAIVVDARAEGTLVLDGTTLVVDLRPVPLAGEFRFNGAPTPALAQDNATIALVDPSSGDEIVLGETRDGEYTTLVLPGHYEVHYRVVQSTGTAAINGDAVVLEVDITNSEVPELDDIDVPIVDLTGAFFIAGAPAPAISLESGRVRLRRVDTGDEFVVGDTSDAEYAVPIIAGSYEVVYSHLQGSAVVPRNTAAVVAWLDAVGTSTELDIDIPTVEIAGELLVDGLPPPTDPANVGELSLRGSASDDEVPLGPTTAGSYARIVIPGDYDVYYSQQAAAGGVPINTNARLATAIAVDTPDAVGAIDVPFVSVVGDVTIDGGTPPTSEYDDGRIYLRNVSTGDSVLLGNTRLGEIGGLVVPGDYEVYYVVETPGAIVPQNSSALLGSVTVDGSAPEVDLPVDIPVATLIGPITLDGAPPPVSDAERAEIFLHDVTTDDAIFLGPVDAGAFALPLTTGRYLVVYRALETNGILPGNARAALTCLDLLP